MTRIVAFDGGLRTCGAVGAEMSRGRLVVEFAGAFFSEPQHKVRRLSEGEDLFRRSRELARWTRGVLDICRPRVVALEEMGYPQNAHAAKCVALGQGVFAAEFERDELPVVQNPAIACRRALVYKGVEAAARSEAVRRFPTAVGPLSRVPPELQEHALDALVVLAWSVSTDLVRSALAA